MKASEALPSLPAPYANAYPNKKYEMAPMQIVMTFLNMMLTVFFMRMEPASSMENPACMKKTITPQMMIQIWLALDCVTKPSSKAAAIVSCANAVSAVVKFSPGTTNVILHDGWWS